MAKQTPELEPVKRFIARHTRAGALSGATDAIYTVTRFTDFVVFTGRAVVERNHRSILSGSLSR